LRVVKSAGDFLAVSRHKRNRRAAVEQRYGRLDLLLADPEFFRDLSIGIYHVRSFQCGRAGPVVRRADAAYGPSPIDLSTRRGEEIDLWIDAFRPPKRSDLREAAYSHCAPR